MSESANPMMQPRITKVAVNIGVGALSTMKGFKKLNLNTLLDSYRGVVGDAWSLGPNLERPRAWRLPMSTVRRHGPGWVAIGDAAGLVNPMNGEGIDYGLESGMLAAERFLADPATAPEVYDRLIGERFDAFLRTGRRFAFVIGHSNRNRVRTNRPPPHVRVEADGCACRVAE